MWKFTILSTLALVTFGLSTAVTSTLAQYPPPIGGVTVESSSTTTETGGTTQLTCSAFSEDGSPLGDVPCKFAIVSEPGNDAALGSKEVTKLTDADGIATTELYVGTTPGVIAIEVSSLGLTSSVLVVVEGDGPLPPQAPRGTIQPPATGSGGLR